MSKTNVVVNDAPGALYDTDFVEWTQVMAERLGQRDSAALDWDNIAEEIESLGRRDRLAVRSRLRVIILHLLKWQLQTEHRSGSWEGSIIEQRLKVLDILEESPSLRRDLARYIQAAYPGAARRAVREMRLLKNPFPKECPFEVEQILSLDWLPD